MWLRENELRFCRRTLLAERRTGVGSMSSVSTTALRTSSVSHVFLPLRYAIPWTTATASLCRPTDSRYLGDSKRWNKPKRIMNMMNVTRPVVAMNNRHPWSTGQLVMKYHAKRDDTSCPTGHHTDSSVRRELEASGRNSRKRAPSTGRFPPTPVPIKPNRKHTAGQLGAYAAKVPKIAVISSVRLKAMRLPMMSAPKPHRALPMLRPTYRELVVYLTCFSETPNSPDKEGRVKETPYETC